MFALRLRLAESYLGTGQLDKAETYIQRLKASPAAYHWAFRLRVELEVLRGNIDKAQSVYDEARRVAEQGDNVSPALWLNLGLAAATLGHLNEAVELFNHSFDAGAPGVAFTRTYMTTYLPYSQGHGPALMAHPDFQAFLAKMNLDDASIAALEAGE